MKGWSVYEEVAIMVANPNALRKTGTVRDQIVELRLGEHAVASADYWHGIAIVHVTYTDPPGPEAARPIRIRLGEYRGDRVESFKEGRDQLGEVVRSYPEQWAVFLIALSDAFIAAEVLRS